MLTAMNPDVVLGFIIRIDTVFPKYLNSGSDKIPKL
jgi:hypothetical protein